MHTQKLLTLKWEWKRRKGLDITETLMSSGEQKCRVTDNLNFLAGANVEYMVAKGKGGQGLTLLICICHHFLLYNLRSPGEKFFVPRV